MTVLAVDDRLAAATDIGGNHGKASTHGFKNTARESFPVGYQQKDVLIGEFAFGATAVADESDTIRNAEFSGQLDALLLMRAIPDKFQFPRKILQFGKRAKQQWLILLILKAGDHGELDRLVFPLCPLGCVLGHVTKTVVNADELIFGSDAAGEPELSFVFGDCDDLVGDPCHHAFDVSVEPSVWEAVDERPAMRCVNLRCRVTDAGESAEKSAFGGMGGDQIRSELPSCPTNGEK
ncbi:MAG: hypothetical protein AAGA58_08695 [Verrucomicrobiota bacterium]